MNVFDLFAKISLDSSVYETGLRAAKDLGSKVADGISAVFKTAAVSVTAAGTAVAGLAKKSLDASADYEQLVGGVDKIFGASSKKVQEYADAAFKTAGLSANEYMQTVTGFSASLLQSLGGDTEKAADTANRAIIDMADNMNTYGSDMASIQNAYQGFAKQNYTMLDNLKLGYNGTKEEMKRLVEDAAAMDDEMKALGVTVDKDSLEFGNIINAISVMQKHMKIAGTTSKEAAGTISGSIGSMKAAWQNFLTGTGSAEDFSDALSTAFGNISGKLDTIIPRLSTGLTELITRLSPEIPKIMEQTLPTVITGATTLITGLANSLPQMLPAILPSLSKGVVDVATALVSTMPQLAKPIADSVKIIGTELIKNKDQLIGAGKELFSTLIAPLRDNPEGIAKSAVKFTTDLCKTLTNPDNYNDIMKTGFEILDGLIDGLTDPSTIDDFFDMAPTLIGNFATGFKNFLIGESGDGGLIGAASKLIDKIGEYLSKEENRKKVYKAAEDILKTLGGALVECAEVLLPFIGKLAARLAKLIVDGVTDALKWVVNPAGAIADVENPYDVPSDYLEKYNLNDRTWLSVEDQYKADKEYAAALAAYEATTNGASADYATYWDRKEAEEDLIAAYARKYGVSIPGYAEGGIVTKPTLALIGERNEPEAVVPLGHETEVGNMFGGVSITFGNIYVNGVQDAGDEVVRQIDEALRIWQIKQKRGIGGTAWQA